MSFPYKNTFLWNNPEAHCWTNHSHNEYLESTFFSMQVTLFLLPLLFRLLLQQMFSIKNLISSIFHEEMLVIPPASCGSV